MLPRLGEVEIMQISRCPKKSKGQLDAVFEAERDQFTDGQKDVHACRQLWRTVIHRTVDDMRFLRTHRRAAGRLKKHEEERLRRIRENPPHEFIQGKWFEQICDYLQVSPTRVRRAIQALEANAEAA